ncbi:MAG: cytochrome c biogenesis protein CcsA [Burkholderiaceae bacterium]|nr:cytochrome c biogenesis protein CcsA [Burkholderiaceae bacterium]
MQILLVIVHLLAALAYLVAWRAPARFAGALMLVGLALHAGTLYAAIHGEGGWHFGFAPILSATLWIGVAVMWIEGLSVRVEALRSVVLPVAALSVPLPLLFPGLDLSAQATRPLFLPHLLIGTLAYGVLAMAALHALLMTAAERALHGGARAAGASGSPFARFLEDLPPLLVLERILFRFIGLGFALLTLTAFSGVLFSEEIFGQPLRFDHKTVFSLVAWTVFAVLLLGRRLRGWRGRTALRLTFGGFVLLLLAYVGSRLVLEVILHRH